MPENEPLPSWLDMPRRACEENGLSGAVMVMLNPNGSYALSLHGVTHARAVEMLAGAIHMVLSDHDRRVLGGAAGPAAQQIALDIELSNQERQH